MLRRVLKILLLLFGTLLVLLVGFFLYVRAVSVTEPPVPLTLEPLSLEVTSPDSGLSKIGRNWFRKSDSGLYELYVEGDAFERGVINGKLTKELVRYQEEVFNDQLEKLVPSKFYRNTLKHFIGFFNRNLSEYISEEYKLEIYGVSHSASDQYDDIASPYQRILNYHGAHDIGHALQNMSLVGCTAFATWGNSSADGSLIIGRNFDFYVGDEFSRDKIVAFYAPDKGYKFMMVTFGGMTGVLSGMNDAGLTVTINAAKSEIPSAAATPVSLVAREILQYASTIEEAYAIVRERKMFVAESFLIGSSKDGKAAVIEKSPESFGIFNAAGTSIVCTNHFQSDHLGNTELNQEHINTSASPYRYNRVVELLKEKFPNSIEKTATILRDQRGLGNEHIGFGNEKLINQLVAHHAIIFQPEKKLVWVSTAPWQLGEFVCYDLNKIFSMELNQNREIVEQDKTIAADTFLTSSSYHDFVKFSKYRFMFNPRTDLQPDSILKWNSDLYLSYMLAGDHCFENKEFQRAKELYEAGLKKEIATIQEREHMEEQLKKCNDKLL